MGVDVAEVKDQFGQPLVTADESTAAAQVTAGREASADTPPADETTHGEDVSPEDQTANSRPRRGASRFYRRFQNVLHQRNEPTGQLAEANGRLVAKDAEIAVLRELVERAAPARTPSPANPKPVPTDYETYEDYALEAGRWGARDEMQQQAATREEQRQAAAFAQQQAAARAQHADFDQVVSAAADIPVTPVASRLLVNSPVGAAVQYALASDRQLAEQFGRSDAAGQVRIIGMLEAHLAGVSQPLPASRGAARRPVTKAPDPISPVNTTTVSSTKNPDSMTYNEYKAWRAAGGGRR
jgi:hypothetical protein